MSSSFLFYLKKPIYVFWTYIYICHVSHINDVRVILFSLTSSSTQNPPYSKMLMFPKTSKTVARKTHYIYCKCAISLWNIYVYTGWVKTPDSPTCGFEIGLFRYHIAEYFICVTHVANFGSHIAIKVVCAQQ